MRILPLKTYYLSVFIFLSLIGSEEANAQKFYGTTSQGGKYDIGAIISYYPSTNTLPDEAEYSFFTPIRGKRPRTELLEHNGLLYGTTLDGGIHGGGTLYSYDPVDGSHTVLFDFNTESGFTPLVTKLTLYGNKLFGTTTNGGSEKGGTIFSFDLLTNVYRKIFDFERTNPINEHIAGLTLYEGKLYGTTQHGGENNDGILFSIDPDVGTYQKLLDFELSVSGKAPYATLTEYNDILYGSTVDGGASDGGTLFSFDPMNSTYERLFDFDKETIGGAPLAALTLSDGKLFGTTTGKGSRLEGTLFSIDPLTGIFQILFDFEWETSGGEPYTALTLFDGMLYGSAQSGGTNGEGVLFSLDSMNGMFKKLMDFDGPSKMVAPSVALTPYDGILYGIHTSINEIGAKDVGSLISFEPVNGTYRRLIDFNRPAENGRYPESRPVGYKSILYGTTIYGGQGGNGTIYSFDPLRGIHRKLFDFDGTGSGSGPSSELTLYDGIFYGVTREGGLNGNGTLFSFDPSTGAFQKLFDFDRFGSGSGPSAALTEFEGLLYGTTDLGGSNGDGTLFAFDPIDNSYQKLFDFDGPTSGRQPSEALTAYNGKLYGSANWGAANNFGALFSYDPVEGTYQRLFDFAINDTFGFLPSSRLTLYDNKLYGTTRLGGRRGGGTFFSLDPVNGGLTEQVPFGTSLGLSSIGGLVVFDGKLYGTMLNGGENRVGTMISIDPVSAMYIKLNDFSWVNGANPFSGLTLYSAPDSMALSVSDTIDSTLTLEWGYYSDTLVLDNFEVFQINEEDTFSLGTTPDENFDMAGLEECTTYTFLVEGRDTLGNTLKSNTIDVTTTDRTAPVAPVLEPLIDTLGNIGIITPVATDNCDGAIVGITTDPIDFDTPGEYTITWEFEDRTGNSSQAVQDVSVIASRYSLSISVALPAGGEEIPIQLELYQINDSITLVEEVGILNGKISWQGVISSR